jgi:hypothetical protein
MLEIAIKYTNISKIHSKAYVWCENRPSGNPGHFYQDYFVNAQKEKSIEKEWLLKKWVVQLLFDYLTILVQM